MSRESGTEFLEVGGARLECRHVGPPTDAAPTIVLLHEGLGCVGMWRDFPDRLADRTGLGVFAYSRRGYGRSDPAALPRGPDYMHREAVDALPAVLDAIGFRRGLLLGHSDGASIATIYAGSVPDTRVRGLVLLSPHFFVEDVTLAEIARARRAFETGDLGARLARWHGSNVDVAFRGWCDTWLSTAFRDFDIRDCIAYLRVPLLVIQGEADPYGTMAQVAACEEEAYAPVETLALPGCGHAPHIERPRETLDAVAAFVDRLMRVHGEGSGFPAFSAA